MSKNINLQDNTYNGWSNYETWYINLHFFDGYDDLGTDLISNNDGEIPELYDVMNILKGQLEEYIECVEIEHSLEGNYMITGIINGFIGDVNFREIAISRLSGWYDRKTGGINVQINSLTGEVEPISNNEDDSNDDNSYISTIVTLTPASNDTANLPEVI